MSNFASPENGVVVSNSYLTAVALVSTSFDPLGARG